MRRLLLSCSLVLVLGCTTGRKFVADQTAAHHYYFDKYQRLCVEVKGPPTCEEFQEKINLQLRLTRLANEVQKIGKLPKEEVKELKRLVAQIERLP